MARRKLPKVGARALGEVRINKRTKQRYKKRAAREARAIHNPTIQALRAQKKGIRSDQRRENRSISGAVNMASQSIAAERKGLKQSGLKGRYLKDAVKELTAQQGDILRSEPFLKQIAAQDFRSARQDLRADIGAARAEKQTASVEGFQSLLDKARTEAKSVVKRRRARKSKKGDDSKHGEFKKALRVATIEYRSFENKPSTSADWAAFEKLVNKAGGVTDPRIAQRAVARLRNKVSSHGGSTYGGPRTRW